MNRKPFPKSVETDVLTSSGHRCALCFGLNDDLTVKLGQIAHIDRDSQNSTIENAAFLCMTHHAEYDARSTQAKTITPDELKVYQAELYERRASRRRHSKGSIKQRSARKRGVSLEVHDRRVPVYRMTIQFIRDVVRDLKPELGLILKFASDTDEALFLFDETVSDYLETVFKRALELHTASLMLSRQGADENTISWREKERVLTGWCVEQIQEARRVFAPFLRLV